MGSKASRGKSSAAGSRMPEQLELFAPPGPKPALQQGTGNTAHRSATPTPHAEGLTTDLSSIADTTSNLEAALQALAEHGDRLTAQFGHLGAAHG